MNRKILVCYQSVTGFTKQYAQMIAAEVNGKAIDCKHLDVKTLTHYDTIVFGGRFHAGTVDGLKKVKKLVAQSNRKSFIIFATGAMPATAKESIQQAWENNLTADELKRIPHFYLPGGLRYEKMPLSEKIMMKTFAALMKRKLQHKKNKTSEDMEFERYISHSYDLSSKTYIKPLVSLLKEPNIPKA